MKWTKNLRQPAGGYGNNEDPISFVKKNMQTISAIDVGSNAIRMAVGQINSTQNQVDVIENIRIPVRLGQDVFTDGFLSEPTMQAALDAFRRFRKIADGYDVKQIRAVATSAMREAENGRSLIRRVARHTGIHMEVISGEEEARLVHIAVGKVIDLQDRKAVLIDIGGGSIEVALSQNNRLITTESYDMGTVRMLRRLDDRAFGDFLDLLSEYTASVRKRIKREFGKLKFDLCIGTGGNMEELGSLRKRLFKSDSSRLITIDELEALDEKLGKMTLEQRMRKLDLKPDRADVIAPAAKVLYMIAREAKIKEIQIPGVGLKDGVLWDMIPVSPGPTPPRGEQAWTSAMRLGQKYHFDAEHGIRVARTAQSIFDQTRHLHKMQEDECLLLRVASLLHDIGHFIGSQNHDLHGYYILKNSPMIGLEEHQQELIAVIVRNHRRSTLKSQEEYLKTLAQKDRRIVGNLCSLLRLADAIEISHTTRIGGVTMEQDKHCWQLRLNGQGNLLLEKWALAKGKSLFEEVFKTQLEVVE